MINKITTLQEFLGLSTQKQLNVIFCFKFSQNQTTYDLIEQLKRCESLKPQVLSALLDVLREMRPYQYSHIDFVTHHLQHEDIHVRASACETIGYIGNSDSLLELESLMSDSTIAPAFDRSISFLARRAVDNLNERLVWER